MNNKQYSRVTAVSSVSTAVKTWRLCTVMTVLAMATAGCGSVRYPRTYALDLDGGIVTTPLRPTSLGTLAVRDFACPDYLCDGRIVYRPTRTEVGYYEYHRWAMTLRRMITDSVVSRVRAGGGFTVVEPSQHAAGGAYVLTGAIERLEEVDDGRDVQALVTLSAELVDMRAHTTVWRHSEIASEPVRTRDVAHVVNSLSVATRRAIDALVASLESHVASDTMQ
ncbi:MAG TPA: ABC-type transport auxiliary lipoprotein family protein [Vicinamibacterales bacterium]|nr:ABC-type transport auxiliary lipoprotein family protein [Vicinamibacterales bacterium]